MSRKGPKISHDKESIVVQTLLKCESVYIDFHEFFPKADIHISLDIDSIDPFVRMSLRTDYRGEDIRAALRRALNWVLRNRMPDGGFVFLLDREFEYGHPELLGPRNRGAMFPTWFRTLSLALIAQALPDSRVGGHPWHFVRCPGYQFFNETTD